MPTTIPATFSDRVNARGVPIDNHATLMSRDFVVIALFTVLGVGLTIALSVSFPPIAQAIAFAPSVS